MVAYMTAAEAAEKWGISHRRVITLCREDRIPDAAMLGKGLHSFRHTVATQSIVNGADVSTVSAILGHSTVSTTLNIYTHAVRKAKAKAANLMAGLIESDNNKSA